MVRKFFDSEGDLRKSFYEAARDAFEAEKSKYPNYSSLTRLYCGRTGNISTFPIRGGTWCGYVMPETQSDWCRFFDGWQECLKMVEKL
jgi:hypothetical protein